MIIAQTASEIYSELVFSVLLSVRDAEWVREARLIWNYDLLDGRMRDAYEELSGDDQLAQQPFWNDLKRLSRVRNRITHSQVAVTEQEARQFVLAARDFIKYLGARNGVSISAS